MTLAIGIYERGGPERLMLIERPVREPQAREVRIAVKAAAINPTDIKLRSEGTGAVPPPWTPGMEGAGTVESVGPGVSTLRPGDEVMAAVNPRRLDGGAQAALIVVAAASVVRVPAKLSIEQAAALPMNGLTARLAVDAVNARRGETVAVTGGAGVVAGYVIALAKRRGLRIIADCSAADEALVRSFGADVVVPRGQFARAVRADTADGVCAVIDTALLCESALGAVRDGGRLVALRDWRGADPCERSITIQRVAVTTVLERTDLLEELARDAAAGILCPRIVGEVSPGEVREAHATIENGGVRGRIVVRF